MDQDHACLSKSTIAMQICAWFAGFLALVAFHSYARLAEPNVVHMSLIVSGVPPLNSLCSCRPHYFWRKLLKQPASLVKPWKLHQCWRLCSQVSAHKCCSHSMHCHFLEAVLILS